MMVSIDDEKIFENMIPNKNYKKNRNKMTLFK